jgi:hypothetical protein
LTLLLAGLTLVGSAQVAAYGGDLDGCSTQLRETLRIDLGNQDASNTLAAIARSGRPR